MKKRFEAGSAEAGTAMTAAVNHSAQRSAGENRISSAPADDMPNSETIEAMQEAQRMRADSSIGKTYADADQMMQELLADKA